MSRASASTERPNTKTRAGSATSPSGELRVRVGTTAAGVPASAATPVRVIGPTTTRAPRFTAASYPDTICCCVPLSGDTWSGTLYPECARAVSQP